jgi:hypothetical protein
MDLFPFSDGELHVLCCVRHKHVTLLTGAAISVFSISSQEENSSIFRSAVFFCVPGDEQGQESQ